MNTDQQQYSRLEETHINALNQLCGLVNDWATKKGWNEDIADRIERNYGIKLSEEEKHRLEILEKGTQHMLFATEIAEGFEFIRKKSCPPCPHCPSRITEHIGHINDVHTYSCPMCYAQFTGPHPDTIPAMDDKVPELTGEEAELADVLIRIFHYAGKRGIDLGNAVALKHEFNITLPYRHGKKV